MTFKRCIEIWNISLQGYRHDNLTDIPTMY